MFRKAKKFVDQRETSVTMVARSTIVAERDNLTEENYASRKYKCNSNDELRIKFLELTEFCGPMPKIGIDGVTQHTIKLIIKGKINRNEFGEIEFTTIDGLSDFIEAHGVDNLYSMTETGATYSNQQTGDKAYRSGSSVLLSRKK